MSLSLRNLSDLNLGFVFVTTHMAMGKIWTQHKQLTY